MVVVTFVGAGGNLGYKALPVLVADEFISEVRCLSRDSTGQSTSTKVKYIKVDYSNSTDLEKALSGSDVLINAMGTNLDHFKAKVALVNAAAAVGVKVYIPRLTAYSTISDGSEFGIDPHVETEFVKHPMWDSKKEHDVYAESKGLRVISI
jgi:saccharopine dehydrogenase-like NADP-dependent oxidoreductase